MDLLNLLINPGKYEICMLCFNECKNTSNVYNNMEVEGNIFKEILNVADMMKYLFPAFEVALAQVCTICSDLIIKMYLIIKQNNHKKNILNIIINTINKELKENNLDFESKNLNIDLSKILNFKVNADSYFSKNINENIDKPYESKPESEVEDIIIEKQCSHCLKTFDNIKLYKVHLKNHRRTCKKRFYYCNQCNYKSLCKTSVQGHKNKNHLKTRPYVCRTCYKSFYHKKNLTAHILSHEQARNDICEVCGERFLHKKNLLEHLKLHSGVRPYECEICGKKFVTSGRRLEHIKRIHMEKTECCLLCDKKFSLNKELKRHIKTVHA